MIDSAERATILAALRFYQQQGQAEPSNRRAAIHQIATDDDCLISLDANAIDDLCERLNSTNASLEARPSGGVTLTWSNEGDISEFPCFSPDNVVQVNGTDYCIDASDPSGLTLTPSDEKGKRIEGASFVTIQWPMTEHLHFY